MEPDAQADKDLVHASLTSTAFREILNPIVRSVWKEALMLRRSVIHPPELSATLLGVWLGSVVLLALLMLLIYVNS